MNIGTILYYFRSIFGEYIEIGMKHPLPHSPLRTSKETIMRVLLRFMLQILYHHMILSCQDFQGLA